MKFFYPVLLLLLCAHSALWSKEYFVSPAGNDKSQGSFSAPFKTLQRGVNALNAGDTLTILPGTYHESVLWYFDGAADKVTTVRAKVPGTVLLHGDKTAAGFKAVPGKKNCYVLPWPVMPGAVNECDTYTVYRKDDSITGSPHPAYGAYSYDAKKKLLYIATSDAQPPDVHAITVSEIPHYGFRVLPKSKGEKVRNVIIDGLCARGFARLAVTAHSSLWGFSISKGEKCMIRNCSSYLNEGGISMFESLHCRIENCRGYSNGTSKFVVGGNIGFYSSKNSTVDNCISFKSRTSGIKFYGINFCNTVSNTLSIGDYRGNMRIKPNDPGSKFVNSYAPGLVGCHKTFNCVYGVNDYDLSRKGGPTSLVMGKKRVISFPEDFADPWNFDLRLQKNSRFKQGFSGKNVYFVSPAGNDRNDGRSVKTTWKTLNNVPDGATVYLLPGTYPGDLELRASNVTVAGRGQHAPILIQDGKAALVIKGKNTTVKRLNFSGQSHSALLLAGGHLTVECCVFEKQKRCISASGAAHIRISHSRFSRDIGSVTAGKKITGSFLHNISKHLPQGLLCVSNTAAAEKSLAFDGLPYGPYFFQYILQNPKADYITSVPTSSATAEVYWSMNSSPASRLFYREKNKGSYKLLPSYARDSFFYTISLKGLKPGQEYDFFISSLPRMYYTVGTSRLSQMLDPRKIKTVNTKVFNFRTPSADRKVRIWYVSVKGNDQNPGTHEAPFRTIARAALAVAPGDTVLIGQGTYTESIYVTSSGTAEKPITFKAAPNAEVWIEGADRRYCRAFVLFGKEHLRFDGLRFKEYGTEFPNASGSFVIFGGGDVTITRCMHDGRGPGYSPAVFNARYTKNITLTQSVIIGGMTSTTMVEADNVKIVNNVFKKPSIWTVAFLNSKKGRCLFANNIMTDNIRAKTFEAQLYCSNLENLTERNNLYFMRLPRELRRIVVSSINGKREQMTLDEFYKRKGQDGKSFFADPGIKVLSTQLCWRNLAERSVDMKKSMLFFRKNNIEEDAMNPDARTQYRHWSFSDFFAPELYKKYQIGLNDALFKDVAVKPQKGYDQR